MDPTKNFSVGPTMYVCTAYNPKLDGTADKIIILSIADVRGAYELRISCVILIYLIGCVSIIQTPHFN